MPEIYVEHVPDAPAGPGAGPFRVVVETRGDAGVIYLYFGGRPECHGVAHLIRFTQERPYALRALLQALGRPELAEQVKD